VVARFIELTGISYAVLAHGFFSGSPWSPRCSRP
jgi:hypothetical protein